MSTIAVGQTCADFKRKTPICGNCQHEQRNPSQVQKQPFRSCRKHGWLVQMSGTCNSHSYRVQRQEKEAEE